VIPDSGSNHDMISIRYRLITTTRRDHPRARGTHPIAASLACGPRL